MNIYFSNFFKMTIFVFGYSDPNTGIDQSLVSACFVHVLFYKVLYSVPWFLSDEGPMLEMLDYTIRIGSTTTILYFNFYLHSAYAAQYVYYLVNRLTWGSLGV